MREGGEREKAENEENKKNQVGGGTMETENRVGKGTQGSQKRKEVQKEWQYKEGVEIERGSRRRTGGANLENCLS